MMMRRQLTLRMTHPAVVVFLPVTTYPCFTQCWFNEVGSPAPVMLSSVRTATNNKERGPRRVASGERAS